MTRKEQRALGRVEARGLLMPPQRVFLCRCTDCGYETVVRADGALGLACPSCPGQCDVTDVIVSA